jgi:hypothetical protein
MVRMGVILAIVRLRKSKRTWMVKSTGLSDGLDVSEV